MKILFKDKMVETSKIISFSTGMDDYRKEEKFWINVSFTNTGQQFHFERESDRDSFLEKIMEQVDEERKKEKTYLDGFKEGTEYALKLMEKR